MGGQGSGRKVLGPERVCSICEDTTRDMVADHCHESGAVRDWLCRSCNTGLGMFKDKPEALRRAAEYLERHKASPRIGLEFLREQMLLHPRSVERKVNRALRAVDTRAADESSSGDLG